MESMSNRMRGSGKKKKRVASCGRTKKATLSVEFGLHLFNGDMCTLIADGNIAAEG